MATARRSRYRQFVFIALSFGCSRTRSWCTTFGRLRRDNSNSCCRRLYQLTRSGARTRVRCCSGADPQLWILRVAAFSRSLPAAFVARVLAVMGWISFGFLAFLIFTSNPFERLLPGALEGRDLNPLLQDPGMIVHPPLLYTGYVGFSVAFAFAIAALLERRVDAQWVRWSRPWTNVAWSFLTLGIALGSFWAYYELGWGGWWFWDPVENASFMPWLVGLALLHSQAVAEKRGTFRGWTLLLAIAAFSLSLLGTFLVRSGVLTSVHAFASDPQRGLFILGFLTIGSALARAVCVARTALENAAPFRRRVSRETLLLAQHLLLSVAGGDDPARHAVSALLAEALGLWTGSRWTRPYFACCLPADGPLVLLVTVRTAPRWQREQPPTPMRWSAALGRVALAGGPAHLRGGRSDLAHHRRGVAGFGCAGTLRFLLAAPGGFAPPLSAECSMVLAHAGLAAVFLRRAGDRKHHVEHDVAARPGQSFQLRGYEFRFEVRGNRNGPNYMPIAGASWSPRGRAGCDDAAGEARLPSGGSGDRGRHRRPRQPRLVRSRSAFPVPRGGCCRCACT